MRSPQSSLFSRLSNPHPSAFLQQGGISGVLGVSEQGSDNVAKMVKAKPGASVIRDEKHIYGKSEGTGYLKKED